MRTPVKGDRYVKVRGMTSTHYPLGVEVEVLGFKFAPDGTDVTTRISYISTTMVGKRTGWANREVAAFLRDYELVVISFENE